MIKIECPSCMQRALPFVQPETVCENCETAFKATDLKDIWPNSFPDKIQPIKVFRLLEKLVFCSKCFKESMLFHEDIKLWMCFNCYRTWQEHQLKFCEYCKFYKGGEHFSSSDACNSCWEYYMNYDKYKSKELPPAWMWKKYDFYKDKIFW